MPSWPRSKAPHLGGSRPFDLDLSGKSHSFVVGANANSHGDDDERLCSAEAGYADGQAAVTTSVRPLRRSTTRAEDDTPASTTRTASPTADVALANRSVSAPNAGASRRTDQPRCPRAVPDATRTVTAPGRRRASQIDGMARVCSTSNCGSAAAAAKVAATAASPSATIVPARVRRHSHGAGPSTTPVRARPHAAHRGIGFHKRRRSCICFRRSFRLMLLARLDPRGAAGRER